MRQRFIRYFGNASIWLVIGMSGILVVVVVSLAIMNHNQEKEFMIKILSEKGASLIRAFEAGARTGMMGEFGTSPRLDTLIKETASQQDIVYISIVDSSGVILAHNDADKIGETFLDPTDIADLEASGDTRWRAVKDNEPNEAFEVYKLFLPVLPDPAQSQMRQNTKRMTQNRMGVWCDTQWMKGLQGDKMLNPKDRPIIFIGMDTSSFEKAINEDIQFTIVISGILVLLGLAGVVSLFWAQNYTRSRKMLSNIRAFASEMVANLPEGIILTDNTFKIRYINQVASKMIGVDSDAAVGHDSKEILPENIFSVRASNSLDEIVSEREAEISRQDGKTTPASVIATEVIAEDGTFVGVMYILKDLTQLKQLQLEIQKKDKLAVIGNLAAGIAHEVRNPLSSIKGYALYFKTQFPRDSENRKAAEVLVSETERLNRVITELLEISRPSDIKPQQIDIRSILDTTLRLVQPDSETGSKVIITVDVDDAVSQVFADPDRLVQVLMNIYLNSLQAMPDGGLLKTQVFPKDNQTVIGISDTGTGMSEEARKQMFNPYFTTKTTGTGLGLAIVQKIIEAHNGEIDVNSEKGKGTSITIVLPNP
jgi:two-component system sensor histidine kinase HydH